MQVDLDEKNAAEAAELVPAIAIETPRTEIAAIKLKLLSKLSAVAYDAVIRLISEIAAETARKVFFEPGAPGHG
jgi:hypothetical protein